FDLEVSAVSIDRLVIGAVTHEKRSALPETLPLTVTVKGVADGVNVTQTPQEYSEAELDDPAHEARVMLADLVTLEKIDEDGSETLSLRVTGLPEGFSLSEGALMSEIDASGTDRIWVLNTSGQFD